MKIKKSPRTQAVIERDHKQLRRLEVFTDVVFALAFFRIFMLISVTLALVGFLGVLAWSYALKGRKLLLDSITDKEASELRIEFLNEPVTALVTIPFVWGGTTAWTIARLSGLLISRILNWLHNRKGWSDTEISE